MKLATIIVAISWMLLAADAFMPMGITTRRSAMTMKRGRGSFKKEINGSGDTSSAGGAAAGMGPSRNWIDTNKKVDVLPKTEGEVTLLETGAFLLKDAATNPNGAVGVAKYGGETHCFDSACPQCKVPLTKAAVLAPNEETGSAPRLSCDLCKSTYNLKTGEKVASAEKAGFFGGIANAVFSSQENGPLRIFALGEKAGKILFSMD